MGSPVSQIQAPQNQSQGKMGSSGQISDRDAMNVDIYRSQGQFDDFSGSRGKGGRITYPGQSGQPQYGQPNRYSNTVGPWDNASIGTQNPFQRSGKGKGA